MGNKLGGGDLDEGCGKLLSGSTGVIEKMGTGLKESLLSLFRYLNGTAALQKAFVKNMFIMYLMLMPVSQLYKQLQNTINQSINRSYKTICFDQKKS